MQSPTTTTTFDGQLEALNHVTRRRILHMLRKQTDAVDVERYDDFEASAIEMQHVHLPKLEELGYITDGRGGDNHVERGPRFDEIVPLLELLDSHGEKLPVEWL